MVEARRTDPYRPFHFRLTIDGVALGGFAEVSGLGTEVTVTEYRAGHSNDSAVRKITGLHKAADVTLKRGVIRSSDLYDWQGAARDERGDAARTVEIALMDEAGRTPVMVWRLVGARPLKVTGPALNAKGNEVAMEELVLSAEGIELIDPDPDP